MLLLPLLLLLLLWQMRCCMPGRLRHGLHVLLLRCSSACCRILQELAASCKLRVLGTSCHVLQAAAAAERR
jgi:hypothetical protein